MKKFMSASVALVWVLTGCGGGGGTNVAVEEASLTAATDVAVATLGADLVAPPAFATLESDLVPDAAQSVASDFPAGLKPPAI